MTITIPAIASPFTNFFAVVFFVTILTDFIQSGFLISFNPLEPKLEKLNPVEGAKKFFQLKQYIETFKSIIKMTIVIAILYFAIKKRLIFVLQSHQYDIWQVLQLAGQIVIEVVTKVGFAYLLIALLDYFYQRFEFLKEMRMSKKEIKEEYKRLEGDPMVKQRQRDAARQMALGRQMGSVPGADVVVTNPIHIAVAVQYKAKDKTPVVLAKGKRLVAEEIKRIADKYNIPIVENKPVAQALYKTTRIGDKIPPDLYKVVADVLAYVYHLKKKRKSISTTSPEML